MKPINKKGLKYQNAFYEVFKSAQLSGAYVIYYDIDFSKEELKNFSKKLIEHNTEEIDHKINLNYLRKLILEKYAFDVSKAAIAFPYRAKIKMYGKKTSSSDILTVTTACTDAVECYLLLAVYTLCIDYNFTQEQVVEWYEKFVEFCKLYADGLTDEHVFKYFIQECDLKITEE